MELLTSICIGGMFAVGLFLMLRRNVVRSAIGLAVLSNSVNLFLLSCGAYHGMVEPYTTAKGQISDPLPQALILTAIVISMGGFSFVLAMLYVFTMRYRTADLDKLEHLKH